MEKYYAHPEYDEKIVDAEEILEYMEHNEIKELEVEVAKRMPFNTGIFYCAAVNEALDKSDGLCGKVCEHYKPRNGRSGICKHQRHAFVDTGNFETFNIER